MWGSVTIIGPESSKAENSDGKGRWRVFLASVSPGGGEKAGAAELSRRRQDTRRCGRA